MIQNQITLEQTMKSLLDQGVKLRELEKQYIEVALAHADDKRSIAAHVLGIPQRTLYDKISKLKIRRFNSFAPSRKDIALSAIHRLGDMIRIARKRKNLEPKELAYAIGYKDVSSLSHIENGRRVLPVELIPRLSSLLGIPGIALERAILDAQIEKENTEKSA